MPYTTEHKQQTRGRIVESARRLFNRRGFDEVSIDEIMAQAGLTRGGFYNHFQTKEELYCEALSAFARANPTERWPGVRVDLSCGGPKRARQIVEAYLSREHLEDVDGHCPMVALSSDVSRAGPAVREIYAQMVQGLAGMVQEGVGESADARATSLAVAALCIGAMTIARTVDDAQLAQEVREAARRFLGKNGLLTDPINQLETCT
jgi:AcrR family transcriptional regulator